MMLRPVLRPMVCWLGGGGGGGRRLFVVVVLVVLAMQAPLSLLYNLARRVRWVRILCVLGFSDHYCTVKHQEEKAAAAH